MQGEEMYFENYNCEYLKTENSELYQPSSEPQNYINLKFDQPHNLPAMYKFWKTPSHNFFTKLNKNANEHSNAVTGYVNFCLVWLHKCNAFNCLWTLHILVRIQHYQFINYIADERN